MKLSAPNKENHRALWLWLAEHPEAKKWDWPGWETMERLGMLLPINHCFLCRAFPACITCPMMKLGPRPCHNDPVGFYYQWEASADPKERARLALKIANCWK